MYLNTDYIAPAELSGYVRAALADLEVNQFTLSRFLPDRPIDDLDYRFTRGGEGLAEAATFRNYDTPAPFGKRPGTQRVSGELPAISRQLRLGEYDRLRQRAAGGDQVVNAIFADAVRMTRAVAARMELARGEALNTGAVAIDENGLTATADFGRKSTHSVTAAIQWTVLTGTSATPLTDLISWSDTYRASNGEGPGVILTSQKVVRLMQRNPEIIAAITGAAAERTRVTNAELTALLQSEGLPGIEVFDAQVNVGGSATRIIPESQLLLLPAPAGSPDATDLGATLWGTTSESLDPAYGIEDGEEPGIVSGVYRSDDPVALFTKAAGIGLPVLANPDLSFSADVA